MGLFCDLKFSILLGKKLACVYNVFLRPDLGKKGDKNMTAVNPKIFDPILGRDETVIETFKPNKTREVILNLVGLTLGVAVFVLLPILCILLGLSGSDGSEGDSPWIVLIPCFVIFGVFFLLGAIGIIFGYKKKAFCVTNKRVIIRSGIIGTDFKTLEFDLVGGISVNVGIFDKMMKPNTGKISFASAASPVLNNGKGVSTYIFTAIENPYDAYKRIKEIYDDYKETKQNKD